MAAPFRNTGAKKLLMSFVQPQFQQQFFSGGI